jgi:hypothetical protein
VGDGGEEKEGEQLVDTKDRGEESIMGSVHAVMMMYTVKPTMCISTSHFIP